MSEWHPKRQARCHHCGAAPLLTERGVCEECGEPPDDLACERCGFGLDDHLQPGLRCPENGGEKL